MGLARRLRRRSAEQTARIESRIVCGGAYPSLADACAALATLDNPAELAALIDADDPARVTVTVHRRERIAAPWRDDPSGELQVIFRDHTVRLLSEVAHGR